MGIGEKWRGRKEGRKARRKEGRKERRREGKKRKEQTKG
jgi:hypothetical protein